MIESPPIDKPRDIADKPISRAKRKARPELLVNCLIDEWTTLDLANKLDLDAKLNLFAQRDTVERINVNLVSREQFIEQYEKPLKPVVLTNVTNNWPATHKWTIENLLQSYKDERFKCGEDDLGYNVKLKLKYFVHYMRNNRDDSPLYIFDGNFGEHRRKKRLSKDYSLPAYFEEDLFKYAGENKRPPYRWLVIGSPRSGTGLHIDPLGTSAWNAILSGYKCWCLFPTSVPRDLLKVHPSQGGKQTSEAVQWFNLVYPKTKQMTWPKQYQPIEILQKPGETVYVPSGWWHVVMNLTDTVAVTQNFASSTNFPVVWHKTKRSRPKLAASWLVQLQRHRPDLVELTKSIDTNSPIGITSDSSSDCSSSSSSSSSSSCSCSSSSCGDNDDDDDDDEDHEEDGEASYCPKTSNTNWLQSECKKRKCDDDDGNDKQINENSKDTTGANKSSNKDGLNVTDQIVVARDSPIMIDSSS